MVQKVCLLFLLVLTVECVRNHKRQDAGTLRKESSLKSWKRAPRGDVFENLFIVYDPSFLSGVWPKITNEVHLMLETACWEDMSVFLRDLSEGRAWAYDAVDASGRYQSALFAGSRFWLGSKQECIRLDNNSQGKIDNETWALIQNNDNLNSVLRRQKYFDAEINDWRWMVEQDEVMDRLVVTDHHPPYRMVYTTLQIQLNITKVTMMKSYDIFLGVCLPQSCPQEDVESIINFSIMLNDNLKSNKSIPRTVKITSSRRIHGDFHIETDAGAILLTTITLILVTLATIATLVDFNLMKCVRYKKQSMSFDLPTYNNSETKLVDELRRKHNEIKSVDDILAESTNRNLVSTHKLPRSLATPPLTLDVVNVDRMAGSCNRCGKYKRQCPNTKQVDNLPACPRVKYSSYASLSTEDRRKKQFFCRLLLCFSIRYCWKRMFNKNTANKDLSLIHIMRILATLWIIFVHVAVIVGYASNNASDLNDRDNLYSIIATGTIAFDTLFFVSGVFSAHHFFYLKSRYTVEELVSFGGAFGQFMQFVCFVTNRVIRLLPSYAYTILLSAVLARASRSTSTLVLPDGDHQNCDVYWWRNLLYITTMYPADEQCLQVSWYLTTETQLHALGALACAVSMSASTRARFVVLTVAAFVLSATAADISEAYFESGIQHTSTYSVYAWMTSRPWANAAPYYAAVLAGWFVHRMNGRMKVNKMSCVAWCVSGLVWSACAALWVLRPAWLPAAGRAACPAALLWPVLVACAQHAGQIFLLSYGVEILHAGSVLMTIHFIASFRRLLSSGGAALSRLSYSMLLLHGAVARQLLMSADVALCSHTACIWMYFAGTTAVTLAAALLLSLLIEMPCCGLFRRLSDCATT